MEIDYYIIQKVDSQQLLCSCSIAIICTDGWWIQIPHSTTNKFLFCAVFVSVSCLFVSPPLHWNIPILGLSTSRTIKLYTD